MDEGVIQGTFSMLQGTFGMIQGTFGVIQGTSGGEHHLPAAGRVLNQRGDVDEVVRVDDPIGHGMPLQILLHQCGVDTHSDPQS